MLTKISGLLVGGSSCYVEERLPTNLADHFSVTGMKIRTV